MNHDAFMQGMMLGGLLVAAVPILLTVGIGIYVFRQYRDARRRGPPRADSEAPL